LANFQQTKASNSLSYVWLALSTLLVFGEIIMQEEALTIPPLQLKIGRFPEPPPKNSKQVFEPMKVSNSLSYIFAACTVILFCLW